MTRIKQLWIMLGVAVIVIRTATKAFFRIRLRRMTRDIADAYTRQWAKRMLNIVKASISKINFATPLHYQAQHCYILMSNHASHYDIPIIFQSLPGSIRMLAKKELFKIPVFGRMLKENDFPPIDRENRKQAIKDLEYAEMLMRSGIVLWIAPEGTRARDAAQMGQFKKGGFILAIKSKAFIIPVGIRGSAKILPAHSLTFSTGKQVEVHIGEPIDASQYTMDGKDSLITRVEKEISRLANVPAYANSHPVSE